MKRLCAALSLVAIAACSATPNSSMVPSSGPMAADTATHSQNNSRPNNARGIAIKSFELDGREDGYKVHGPLPAKCIAVDVGGFATGCEFDANLDPLKLSKMTVGIYTGADAKGCLVAQGTYSGTVQPGQPVPVKLKWRGKCN
jgi:hypothetical protein